MRTFLTIALATLAGAGIATFAQAPNNDLGYTDTPMLPGINYRVHDPARPHPPVVTPSAQPGGAPSDAVVLFSLFCVLGLFVTFVGIFFRGPGYSFVIPYLEFFSIGTPGLHFAL